MGVVTFQRATDAVLARSKYNGKVIDGSKFFSRPMCVCKQSINQKLEHKLKIELVTDSDEPLPKAVKEHPSLLSRISGLRAQSASDPTPSNGISTPPAYVPE